MPKVTPTRLFYFLSAVLLYVLGSLQHACAAKCPCDIYGDGGTPCVAAHSTVRALYSSYNGPLYQVRRTSDGALLNIGVLSASGFANAAVESRFFSTT